MKISDFGLLVNPTTDSHLVFCKRSSRLLMSLQKASKLVFTKHSQLWSTKNSWKRSTIQTGRTWFSQCVTCTRLSLRDVNSVHWAGVCLTSSTIPIWKPQCHLLRNTWTTWPIWLQQRINYLKSAQLCWNMSCAKCCMVVELLMIWIVNCSLLSVRNTSKMVYLMSTSTYSLVTIRKTNQPSNTKCQLTQVLKSLSITSISVPFLKTTHLKYLVSIQMPTWLSVWTNQSIWSIQLCKLVQKKHLEVEEKPEKNLSRKRPSTFYQKCPWITIKTKLDSLSRSSVVRKLLVLSVLQFHSTFSFLKKLRECRMSSISSERLWLTLVMLLMAKLSWPLTSWTRLTLFSMREFHQSGFTIQQVLKLLGSFQLWRNGSMTWLRETNNFTNGWKAQDHTLSGWVVSSTHKDSWQLWSKKWQECTRQESLSEVVRLNHHGHWMT